jgi:hypothetical protein
MIIWPDVLVSLIPYSQEEAETKKEYETDSHTQQGQYGLELG